MAVVGAVLESPMVKALIAVSVAAASASPVLRFFHDRAEKKLREREVAAQERMAEAAMIQAVSSWERRKR